MLSYIFFKMLSAIVICDKDLKKPLHLYTSELKYTLFWTICVRDVIDIQSPLYLKQSEVVPSY